MRKRTKKAVTPDFLALREPLRYDFVTFKLTRAERLKSWMQGIRSATKNFWGAFKLPPTSGTRLEQVKPTDPRYKDAPIEQVVYGHKIATPKRHDQPPGRRRGKKRNS